MIEQRDREYMEMAFALAKEAVMAHVHAVIAGEDYKGILPDPHFLQPLFAQTACNAQRCCQPT